MSYLYLATIRGRFYVMGSWAIDGDAGLVAACTTREAAEAALRLLSL